MFIREDMGEEEGTCPWLGNPAIPDSGPFYEPIFPIWFPIPIGKFPPLFWCSGTDPRHKFSNFFFAENCSRPFFAKLEEKRRKDIYSTLTRQKDIYYKVLCFPKKSNKPRVFFRREAPGGAANDDGDDDDNDSDGDGDGRAPRGQWGAAAAADCRASSVRRTRVSRVRVYVFQIIYVNNTP
jgi:hypothetical protein